MIKQMLWPMVSGAAFGYLEATAVYLREIYYPEVFTFSLVIINGRILLTEVLSKKCSILPIQISS